MARWYFGFVLLVLSGCALQPAPPAASFSCQALFQRFDQAVAHAGVGDAQYARIEGFPAFRVDRFLSSLRHRLDDSRSRREWLAMLRALDREARAIEYRNLPFAARRRMPADVLARLAACGERAQARLLQDVSRWSVFLRRAEVPDAYSRWRRWLGLYPLTSRVVTWRVAALQARLREDFEIPLAALPRRGRLHRYALALLAETAQEIPWRPGNALAVPVPGAMELEQLLIRHAPVFEIDVVSDDDRPGVPVWRDDGLPTVDVSRPVLYWHLSHTRFDGQVLLQINYMLWFPARTAAGALDIYAGRLDSLIWRVTLDLDGQPLLHESVHGCGCYHQFYPTRRLRARAAASEAAEPLFIPQVAPEPGAGERLVVRLSAGRHYVQRLYVEHGTTAEHVLQARPYRELRSLPWRKGQRRSLFGPDGLVAGSQRLERWLLWPMGVSSAGAMRQWGQHAVAFVGRRHFDDPDLLARYFRRAETD